MNVSIGPGRAVATSGFGRAGRASERGWRRFLGDHEPLARSNLPGGTVVVDVARPGERMGHITVVSNGVVHNLDDCRCGVVIAFWLPPSAKA